ncbi:uncharacterized protein LOC128992132 [Macrosteles quadrilineatus]|uniref:uncharacterized protein LOC128992132 n=1 Tax=Macrosteles quadrilineatus TaxID=74068 RepID=UPI0023E0A09C|nr:uncharacterized protein LOC128992132 [Macrosteles quadrilineatus]
MMIHRSASSRRRRASRSAASSPHRSQTLRRPSVAVGATTPTGSAPSLEAAPRARRASIASVTPSEELAVAGVRGVTVTAAEEDTSDYGHDSDDNLNDANLMPDNYNRSPRSSLVPEGNSRSRNSLVPESGQFNRSRNNLAVDNFNRSPRNSLVPDTGRSPRNSLVPDYSRSPRGSLLPDVEQFSRSARNSMVPEEYGRNSRNNLVPDSAYSRSARNSLVPDVSPSRSQRNSLVPDPTRSPRGSLVPEPNTSRSPRGSIVGDLACRSPRGSIGPDLGVSRSPRGSIASEASFNRSPRNSLPLQDGLSLGRSPRGSLSSTGGGLFDSTRSPRGSIDMNAPGTSRAAGSNRSPSPYRMAARGAQGALNSTDAGGSRRASSSVSQVSADDRKHLCEHTKLTADTGLGLSAYGSVVYQLNHANMESSGLCDFVCRALGIVYRTVVVTVVLVCLTALPIVMFIMGIQFVRDCPKEPNIPVYMIVGGSFGTIKIFWMLWCQVKSRRYERLDGRNRSRPAEDGLSTSAGSRITNFLLSSFLIVWFVLGNLWILGIYWPPFEPTLRDPNRWCHKTLYVFSLVHLVVVYSLLGVVVLTVIVMVACQICICPLLISCK